MGVVIGRAAVFAAGTGWSPIDHGAGMFQKEVPAAGRLALEERAGAARAVGVWAFRADPDGE